MPCGAAPSLPRAPGPDSARFDRVEESRVPAFEPDEFLPEPAALGQEHEHADEDDQEARARDAGNGQHEPEHDQRERHDPAHQSRQESEHRVAYGPGSDRALAPIRNN